MVLTAEQRAAAVKIAKIHSQFTSDEHDLFAELVKQNDWENPTMARYAKHQVEVAIVSGLFAKVAQVDLSDVASQAA